MRAFALLAFLALPSLAAADELSGTLAHIQETGEITIGYRSSRPPVSFVDPAGIPNGYSVDLCRRIADEVRVELDRDDIEVNFRVVGVEDRFDALENGTIDILCGATTKTLGRMERVGFSQLTLVTGGTLLSLQENRVDSVSDLAGQRVAVLSGTTTDETLSAVLGEQAPSIEIVRVSEAEEAFALLLDREVAAYAADQVALIGQVLSQSGSRENYHISSEIFSFEPYALAIRRGDPDFALVADRTLSRIFRSGQIQAIYRKSFGPYGMEPPNALLALYQLMSTPE